MNYSKSGRFGKAAPLLVDLQFSLKQKMNRQREREGKSYKFLNRLSVFTSIADKWMTWRRKIIPKLGKWSNEMEKEKTKADKRKMT